MTFLLICALGASLAADPAERPTKTAQTTGVVAVAVSETNAAVETEYQKLLAEDDAAQAEVDKWIRENNEFKSKGAGTPDAELNRRIHERFAPIRTAYEDFLRRHPAHARAHLAYGSFLGDQQDEAGAQAHWEKALELDPKNPAVYNNLGGVYSESGKPEKAFEYFSKAIELNPSEGLYYHNFGDSIYVLRKTAMEYYHLTEQQVYARAMQLYSNAVRLDPQNFPFASDLAQTYYPLEPFPADDALKAWNKALKLAHDELEREGVYVHLARVKMLAGRLSEARAQLNAVTNESYATLKSRLIRSINDRENPAPVTNAPPPAAEKKP